MDLNLAGGGEARGGAGRGAGADQLSEEVGAERHERGVLGRPVQVDTITVRAECAYGVCNQRLKL
jgi:hypothetical protein